MNSKGLKNELKTGLDRGGAGEGQCRNQLCPPETRRSWGLECGDGMPATMPEPWQE